MTLQTYMAGLIFLERTQKEDINISDTRKSSSDERDKKKFPYQVLMVSKFLMNH